MRAHVYIERRRNAVIHRSHARAASGVRPLGTAALPGRPSGGRCTRDGPVTPARDRPVRRAARSAAARERGPGAGRGRRPAAGRAVGADDPSLGAPEAWTQSRGDGVVVAVLDSGVQLDHPDLAENLWRNPGETPGNGVDDDRNGYVDDVHGANILALNGDVEDDNGHGTHVAGIVAAQAGNGIGGSGLARGAKIMSVKVLDANRAGDSSLLAKGIRYAVDQGARILNVSINGDGTSADLDAALIATPAEGRDDRRLRRQQRSRHRPHAVLPGLLDRARGAHRDGDAASAAACWRSPTAACASVDLAAPGGDILSTRSARATSCAQGTSMAAPFVSGSLALLAAARPDLGQSAAARRAACRARRGPRSSPACSARARLNVGRRDAQRPARRQRWRDRRPARRLAAAGDACSLRVSPSAVSAPAARRPSAGSGRRRRAGRRWRVCSTACASRPAGHEVAAASRSRSDAPLEGRRARRRGHGRLRGAVQGPAHRWPTVRRRATPAGVRCVGRRARAARFRALRARVTRRAGRGPGRRALDVGQRPALDCTADLPAQVVFLSSCRHGAPNGPRRRAYRCDPRLRGLQASQLQTNKSKRNNPDRITLRKYCKWCKQHTSHRETR